MLNNKKKKGFTLIELIIVIAIIAILAAIAIPKFGDIRRNAALKSDVANAKVIANAASALIAEGKIEVPTDNNINIDIIEEVKKEEEEGNNINADSNPDRLATAETIDPSANAKAEVVKYLQNIPKPETSGYTKYVATIDIEGNVEVKMDGKSTKPNGFKLYPNIETGTP